MAHLSAAVVTMGCQDGGELWGQEREISHDFPYTLSHHFFEEMHDIQKDITRNHL